MYNRTSYPKAGACFVEKLFVNLTTENNKKMRRKTATCHSCKTPDRAKNSLLSTNFYYAERNRSDIINTLPAQLYFRIFVEIFFNK